MKFLKRLFVQKPKIIVIAGPTASGKTSLSIELAQYFNGEVISADSRQVYRGMDIGSAKVRKEEMNGVPHHLLDVADPRETFSVYDYKQQAQLALNDIFDRNKLPIICGGTGFYIDALIYNQELPNVPANQELREKLSERSTDELYRSLTKRDPRRAQSIDPHNKQRIIRALEINEALGAVPKTKAKKSPYDVLYLALELPKDQHHKIIDQRIDERMKQGMLEEVQALHQQGVSWEKLESFGLEYRYLAQHLQGKIAQDEACDLIARESKKFIKRQYTWFKKHSDVRWFNPLTQTSEIIEAVQRFLK